MKFSTIAVVFVLGPGWSTAFTPIHHKEAASTFTRLSKLKLAVFSSDDTDMKLRELREATRSAEAKRLLFERELREFKEELDILNKERNVSAPPASRASTQQVNRNDENVISSSGTTSGFDSTQYKEPDLHLMNLNEEKGHPDVFRPVIPKRMEEQNEIHFEEDNEEKEEMALETNNANEEEGQNVRLLAITATAACLSFLGPLSHHHGSKQDSTPTTTIATKSIPKRESPSLGSEPSLMKSSSSGHHNTPFSFLRKKNDQVMISSLQSDSVSSNGSSKNDSGKKSTVSRKKQSSIKTTKTETAAEVSSDSSNNGGVMEMVFPNPLPTSEVRGSEARVTASITKDKMVSPSSQSLPSATIPEKEEMPDKILELQKQKEEILKALISLREEDEINLVSPASNLEGMTDNSPVVVPAPIPETVASNENEATLDKTSKVVKSSTKRKSVMNILFPNPPEPTTMSDVSSTTKDIESPSLSDEQTSSKSVALTTDKEETELKIMEPFTKGVQATEEVDSVAQYAQDTVSATMSQEMKVPHGDPLLDVVKETTPVSEKAHDDAVQAIQEKEELQPMQKTGTQATYKLSPISGTLIKVNEQAITSKSTVSTPSSSSHKSFVNNLKSKPNKSETAKFDTVPMKKKESGIHPLVGVTVIGVSAVVGANISSSLVDTLLSRGDGGEPKETSKLLSSFHSYFERPKKKEEEETNETFVLELDETSTQQKTGEENKNEVVQEENIQGPTVITQQTSDEENKYEVVLEEKTQGPSATTQQTTGEENKIEIVQEEKTHATNADSFSSKTSVSNKSFPTGGYVDSFSSKTSASNESFPTGGIFGYANSLSSSSTSSQSDQKVGTNEDSDSKNESYDDQVLPSDLMKEIEDQIAANDEIIASLIKAQQSFNTQEEAKEGSRGSDDTVDNSGLQDEIMAAIKADEQISSLEEKIKSLVRDTENEEDKAETFHVSKTSSSASSSQFTNGNDDFYKQPTVLPGVDSLTPLSGENVFP